MTNLKPKGQPTAVEWVFDKMSNVLAGNSSVTTQEILEQGLAMETSQLEDAYGRGYVNSVDPDTLVENMPVEDMTGQPDKDDQWFVNMLNEEAESNDGDNSEYRQYRELPDVPEYIIASISDDACETYVFEATADGKIVSYEEYGGLAERWGDLSWWDAEKAVKSCMKNNYDLVSVKGNHVLFKLVKPDELTHFDGDESDRISY